MQEIIKPCRCGNEMVSVIMTARGTTVYCTKCGSSTTRSTREKAVQAWNEKYGPRSVGVYRQRRSNIYRFRQNWSEREMKCEKCGKELDSILINKFTRGGADTWLDYPFAEVPDNAVIIDADSNWTGYDLSEEEQLETILCPHCRQFPFKTEQVQHEEIVRIILFKEDAE